MIRYTLTCSKDHGFDSWFQSATAYDALSVAGQLACPVCGDGEITKALMAPSVRPARNAAAPPEFVPPNSTPPNSTPPVTERPDLATPTTELEKAAAVLRRHIEETSDYVGVNFVAEARRMHLGDVPERSIYGEARPEEARKLLEDGIPVAPLPFLPARKTN